jgi:DNA replicative helicase MCM subunit Mcm2 (Cdc46/Mcm family)
MDLKKFIARYIMYKVNKNKDLIPFEDIVKEASKKKFRESEVQDIIKELQKEGFISIELGESLMIKPLKEREDFSKAA